MFQKFAQKFVLTGTELIQEDKELYKDIPQALYTLLNLHGGKSFNNGLYRVHSFNSSVHWSLIIGEFFPKYQSKVYPFGFDWMGRQFCMSTSNESLLFMLDPATGEDFELQQELNLLHDDDFVNTPEDILASDLFSEVLQHCKLKFIKYNECIGYKIPLFLGGEDSVGNYQKSDLEVYWEIQNQLYKKAQNLPEGTKIKSIKFE